MLAVLELLLTRLESQKVLQPHATGNQDGQHQGDHQWGEE
jgi:hypothetical protein